MFLVTHLSVKLELNFLQNLNALSAIYHLFHLVGCVLLYHSIIYYDIWLHGTVPGTAGGILFYWVCKPYLLPNIQKYSEFCFILFFKIFWILRHFGSRYFGEWVMDLHHYPGVMAEIQRWFFTLLTSTTFRWLNLLISSALSPPLKFSYFCSSSGSHELLTGVP